MRTQGRRFRPRRIPAAGLVVAMLVTPLALWLTPWLSSVPAARADGGAPNLAYIAGGGSGANELVAMDIGNRSISWRLALDGKPHSVLLSADSREAYVTEPSANKVAIVDTRGHQISARVDVGPSPTALALDLTSSPNLLYVTEQGSAAVAIVDPSAQRVVATIHVGPHPAGVAVAGGGSGITNPDDAEVYVTSPDANTVSVIGAKERRVTATIPVPGGPLAVTVPQTGGVAYATTRAGTVVALSLADHRLLGTVLRTPGDTLGTMDYDAVTGQIYVPDLTANVVDVLRPVSVGGAQNAGGELVYPNEPARTLAYAGAPSAVAITFDGAYGFISERDAGRVAMLDVASHRTLATVTVGGAPLSIITGAYPPLVSHQTASIVNILVIVVLIAGAAYVMIKLRFIEKAQRKQRARQAKQPPPGDAQ